MPPQKKNIETKQHISKSIRYDHSTLYSGSDQREIKVYVIKTTKS